MKKLSIALFALVFVSVSAIAQTTTTPGGGTTTNTTGNQTSTSTTVDAKYDLNVTSISTNGGKGVSNPIPLSVQQQSPGLFGGPATDIETLVQRVDLVFDHFCSGDIPAGINRRLHRDDTEKGDSGNTNVTFAPRGANFAMFASSRVRKSAIRHLEMIGFDATGRMRVRTGRDGDGQDLELYCLGDVMVKASIGDMDKVTNQTVKNDADMYLADRGYFDVHTLISIGMLTKAAPGAVYNTGSGWGVGGSAAGMPVSTLLGALFGFNKSVGLAGATARPEVHLYDTYDCTGKENATCAAIRNAGVRPLKLSALHDVVMTQFVNGQTPDSSEVDKRMAEIAASQQKEAQAIAMMAKAGQDLEAKVAKLAQCGGCAKNGDAVKAEPALVGKSAPKKAPKPAGKQVKKADSTCQKAESVITHAPEVLAACPGITTPAKAATAAPAKVATPATVKAVPPAPAKAATAAPAKIELRRQ